MVTDQGRWTATVVAIAELHGFNATVRAFGRPSFGFSEWASFVANAAGGFVGRLEPARGLPGGLLAYVPSQDGAGQVTPVSAEFIEGIASTAPSAALPFPALAARHFGCMANLLLRLSSSHAPAEASYQSAGIHLDLARGRHLAAPGGRFAVLQDGGRVVFSPQSVPPAFKAAMQEKGSVPASAAAAPPIRKKPVGLAGQLENRIRRMNAAGCGFVLSIAETGDPLVVVGDVPEDVMHTAALSVLPSGVWLSSPGRTPLLLSRDGAGTVALASCGRPDVAVLAVSSSGASSFVARLPGD